MKTTNPPQLFADTLVDYKKKLERRKKYIKNEFQAYGLMLAEELDDWDHKTLYIRLAKNTDKALLDKALYFIKDQTQNKINSKGRLFMWKLKQLKIEAELKLAI
ncbi:MAG: hypothetical protein WC069_01175 [Candidatus Shapirobacteria bacterium]